jgi:hypothetical protein
MLETDFAEQMWGISFNQPKTNRRQLQQGTLGLHVLSKRILYELSFLTYCSPYLLQMEMSFVSFFFH